MLKIGMCPFTERVYVCLSNESLHFLLGHGSGEHPQHTTYCTGDSLRFRDVIITGISRQGASDCTNVHGLDSACLCHDPLL